MDFIGTRAGRFLRAMLPSAAGEPARPPAFRPWMFRILECTVVIGCAGTRLTAGRFRSGVLREPGVTAAATSA